jgi:DNA-binding response OmpR family regulator
MANENQRTILIVEDDEEIAFLIKFMLERENYNVVHMADGAKASEYIQNNESPFLILLDIMLPFKDGFQLTVEIRTNERWKNCPVIMLTAKGQGTDITRALDAGADDYMIKPFQPIELIARMKRFVRKS